MNTNIRVCFAPLLLVAASLGCAGEPAQSDAPLAHAANGGSDPVLPMHAGNAATPLVPMSSATARAAMPMGTVPPAAATVPVAGQAAPSTPVTPPTMSSMSVPPSGAPASPGAPTTPSAPGAQPWNTSGTTCLAPGTGQFGEPGPYQVGMMDVDLGMIQPEQTTGKFTIFYPMPWEAECLHPIVAWGNGTGVNDATTYAFFNSNAASWGMVVIASHDPNTGSGAFHKAGIDYMLQQNEDSASMFHKKLSARVGTSGHSQGAFGSVAGASHPNVSVNVGVGGGASGAAQHASLCLTGTEDIAAETCPGAVDRAQGPFFTASWNMGDHFVTQTLAGYISRDPGTMANQRLYAAWFRCFLADDGVACKLFQGATPADCGVCQENQDWAVLKSKNIP